MKKISIIVLFIFTVKVLFGQGTTPKIRPSSPNVASLMKFTEVPVSTFNGTSNVSIPIYEINTGGISVPISISYHTGGIKVADEASWVGLGWALNAGGVISETVVGSQNKNGLEGYGISPGFGDNNSQFPLNTVEHGVCYRDESGATINVETNGGGVGKSFHYNIYNYNFGSYSGKFIKKGTNIINLDRDNIIFKTYTTNEPLTPYYYTAQTPEGLIYTFKAIGYNIHGEISEASFVWHLSEIKNLTGQKVSFTYVTKNIWSLPSVSESATFCGEYTPLNTIVKELTGGSDIKEYYLDKITFDNGYIKFERSERDDLWVNIQGVQGKAFKLDNIKIYDAGNSLVKRFAFSYDYFQGDVKHGDYTVGGNYSGVIPVIPDDVKKKRLKLLSLTEDNNPAYTFDYNSTTLPYKTAYAQDLWGYFNGLVPTPDQKSFLPNGITIAAYAPNMPAEVLDLGKGFRLPREDDMKAGVLSKITYPTGGYTEFEYEAHILADKKTGTGFLIGKNKGVYDIGSGVQSIEFDVPEVGYYDNGFVSYNPAKLDISLWCCGPQKCDDCPCYAVNGLMQNNIYVKIEHWNVQSQGWQLDKMYDYSTAELRNSGSCSLSSVDLQLRPAKYRITANYPDNQTGQVGIKMAYIGLKYLDWSTNVPENNKLIIGGLRTKSVTNYTKANDVAFKKEYTYNNRVLMSTPKFERVIRTTLLESTEAKNLCAFGVCPPNTNCVTPVLTPVKIVSINSNPYNSFSYSADGSLVGYQSVSIKNGSTGKDVYEYNVEPDRYVFFPSNPPGIPNIPSLTNGKLKKRSVYDEEGILKEEETYEYKIEGYKNYWNYISEYINQYTNVSQNGALTPYPNQRYESYYYYFYPIKVGKVNQIRKHTISYGK